MFFSSELEIIYIINFPSHMDSNSDEINHDGKKGITNHETNDTSTANTKINNNVTSSLSKKDISRINSTSADQKGTTNEEILSLETAEEKRYRRRSLYITFATMFFNSAGYGMLNPSIWPYMNKVCRGIINSYFHQI